MSAPAPELGEVELAVLDILRRDHEHHGCAIPGKSLNRPCLLDKLNRKLNPNHDPLAGNTDDLFPEHRVDERRMRKAIELLERHHFPAWSCQAGYFYGTNQADAEIARRGVLKQMIALQVKLGDITKCAEAEFQRRTAGRAAHQEPIPLGETGYWPNGETGDPPGGCGSSTTRVPDGFTGAAASSGGGRDR